MTKQFLSLIFLSLFSHAVHAAWSEFGRSRPLEDSAGWTRKRIRGWEQAVSKTTPDESRHDVVVQSLLRDLEEILDESEENLMELSLSLSVPSNSAGSGGPVAPSTSIPSVPIVETPTASPVPTMEASFIPSDLPSLAPTGISDAPISLTFSPTVEDNSTAVPTSAPPPVFDCSAFGGLSLGLATDEGATEIFLAVGYRAESTSNSTDDFEEELERQLLETAVLAALGGCDDGFRARRQVLESHEWTTHRQRHLMVDSLTVGPCEPALNETESCFIMETEMIFYLKGDVDSDAAAYASYTAIEEHMVQDKYIGIVPTILLLEYLSPLPLVPPPTTTINGTGDDGSFGSDIDPSVLNSTTATADRLSVSPWTIGACVATIMGGVISLLVYSRNRGQRRHLQLTTQDRRRSHVITLGRRARNPVTI